MSPVELIMQRDLLVTAGAGGVGKTTTAAALALQAALAGRRVAVLTIDPARRLAQALGLDSFSGSLRPVSAEHFAAAGLRPKGELWAMMLDTASTGDAMVRRFAPDERASEAILANRYYQHFSTALAGVQEYMAVEQVRTLALEGRFDLVLLDTPPAVHALEFLEAPGRLIDALDSSAMQLLLKSSPQAPAGVASRLLGAGRNYIIKGLDRLIGGPFLEDFTEFISLYGVILEALKRASHEVEALLRAPESGFLLVTSPSRSNVDEALAFQAALAERGFPFAGFIINRAHPLLPEIEASEAQRRAVAEALAAHTAHAPLDAQTADDLQRGLWQSYQQHQRLARRDADVSAHLWATAEARKPTVVPLLASDVFDLRALAEMGEYLLRAS